MMQGGSFFPCFTPPPSSLPLEEVIGIQGNRAVLYLRYGNSVLLLMYQVLQTKLQQLLASVDGQ